MIFLIFPIVIISFAFIFYQLKYAAFTKAGNRIPGPPNWPLLGNAQYFINSPVEKNLQILGEFLVNYGDTYRVWIGKELNVFFQNSEDIKVIVSGNKFINKGSPYDVMRPWLNEGLLVSKDKKWFTRRKIITPAFHFTILEQYTTIFEKQGQILCDVLKKLMKQGSFELYQPVNRYTMDVISGTKWFKRRKIITPAFHFKILEQFIEVFDQGSIKLVEQLRTQIEKEEFDLHFFVSTCTLDIICGTKWFKRRRIITPAFHFKILEQFIEIFERESIKMVEKLRTQIDKESFDLYFYVNTCTLDVICESAMGVSVNAQTNTDSEYVKAVKTISTVLHKRMFDIFYRFDVTYWFTKLAREEKKALKILHGFTEKIIIQRREEILREKESASQKDTNDVGGKRKMAFLDILLQSEIDGKPLSNLDIREEVDTFMFEGHDTTSSAITFLFYNIARYPDAQNKCFQEILETFGKDKNTPVTYEKLNSLHYTELCIKETLRLFPSVPLLGRRVTKECEINGKIVPAGANIGISPLHLGRMEEIFPNANEFIPERFDVVTNAEKMNPYAYIPFSAGPRNCIGQKFAMLEIKSVVANVLRNFEVEYVKSELGEPLLIGELILRTRDPLMFRLKPRIYKN